jgi:hypothetical protein
MKQQDVVRSPAQTGKTIMPKNAFHCIGILNMYGATRTQEPSEKKDATEKRFSRPVSCQFWHSPLGTN